MDLKLRFNTEKVKFVMKKEYMGLQSKEEKHGYWIKYDRFGYEGLSEVLAYRFSTLLSSRLSFCEYKPIKTDKGVGCCSRSVIYGGEELISLYSFFPNEPKNLNAIQLFDYYIPYIIENTGLQDFGEWLTEMFIFDMLIENEDRNPGNIFLIASDGKYRYAPIMDNANSLGYRDCNHQFDGAKLAKPLMMSHSEQAHLFMNRYGSKLELRNNKILVSDLYKYYLYDDVIHAIEILKRTVSGYFHMELIFY